MVLATLLMIAGVILTGSPAAAQQPREVVADGLANPRGVTVGADGRVLVAEAGRGGETLVDVTMANQANPICVGATGAITEIHNGEQTRLLELPSWTAADPDGNCPGAGAAATGPHGVTFDQDGTASLTIGLAATPEVRPDIAAQFDPGTLFATAHELAADATPQLLADLGDFERTDPDMAGLDTNPYGLTVEGDGSTLVADAGGNTLVRLAGDEPEVVALFAPQCVPFELPIPHPIPPDQNPCGTQEQFPAQSVPTDVAIGPDGNYYVSELVGFPFAPGTARVWRVEEGRPSPATCSTFGPVPNNGCEVYAEGMTGLVGLHFGPDGTLYAAQIADAGVGAIEGGSPLAGRIQVIPQGGGTPTTAVIDLNAPGDVTVSDDQLYITNNSISPDGGQLLRVSLPVPDNPCEPSQLPPSPFDDVADANVHGDAIRCAANYGVTTGVDAETYRPDGLVTREQMASFLDRLLVSAGEDLPNAEPTFEDVTGGIHADAIGRLAEAGIISGVTSERFEPQAWVTRAQAASLVARTYAFVAGAELPTGRDAFDDDNRSPHEVNINRLAGVGIVEGFAGDGYGPLLQLRRDQMASVLGRTMTRLQLARDAVITAP